MRLFDTSFLIDLVKGDKGAVEKAVKVDEEETFKALSVITVHEYLRGIFGLYLGKPAIMKVRLMKAEAELAKFEILPYTYEIAKAAAEMEAELIRNGASMSLADAIIATTALHYRLAVVTRNVEHFRKVPKLDVEKY